MPGKDKIVDVTTTRAAPLLETCGLKTWYPIRKGLLQKVTGHVRAVDGVDLTVMPGETLGLVGESGCGKSSLGRTLMRLQSVTDGDMLYKGESIRNISAARSLELRREMQIIFQDSVGSLDPRLRVRDIVGEGLAIHGIGSRKERLDRVVAMMERVGLRADMANRFPHEFSGGQRQRIGIARALILEPKLVVADEPVSALDVSIQSQVLNLLLELRRDLDLAYVFVAHNLAVVAYVADRIAVMYLGRVIETGPTRSIYTSPKHPYTMSLLSAIPEVGSLRERRRIVLSGEVPSPINPPSGCRFRTRCPIARDICAQVEPTLGDTGGRHEVACHFPGQPIA